MLNNTEVRTIMTDEKIQIAPLATSGTHRIGNISVRFFMRILFRVI